MAMARIRQERGQSYRRANPDSRLLHSQEPDTGIALVKAVQQANEAVARGVSQPGGAGCTLTAAVVVGNSLHVAHVGDSRAYLLRAGQLRRLTHDHTWGAEQIRSGKLKPEQVAQEPNAANSPVRWV